MKYRTLGKTDLKVSEVGFGCWQLGNAVWGGPNEKESIKLINKAIDLGCNFFDTSPNYGAGNSERIIGKALSGNRDNCVIVSKFGHNPDSANDFSKDRIRLSVESSLKNLRTDYLDSVLLHNPDENILKGNEGHYNILEELKQEGKIRSYGASVDSSTELNTLLDQKGVEVAEVFMNALNLDISLAFNRVKKENLGIIVKVPLDSGWLTGKYSPDTLFNTGHRERWSREIKERRFALVNELKFLERKNQTLAQGALRFLLSYLEVSTIIPGAKKESQLESNLLASEGRLTNSDIEKIKNIWETKIRNNPLSW